MRIAKFGLLGLGALLAARAFVGCTSDQGEPGYDAGGLPDVEVVGDDAAPNGDAGALPTPSDDGGGDATISGDDDSGGSSGDDGSVDSSSASDASDGDAHDHDASDGGDHDAGDGATSVSDGSVDASDAASHDVDASDGAANDVDASDASSTQVDAGDASAIDIDASDASSSTQVDASDAALDLDAADAAPACVSCGTSVSYLGGTAAFVSGAGTSVGLQSGTVPDGATVSIITQTYPQNSVTSGNAHVVYATDAAFTTQVDAVMSFDHTAGNNDQWYVVLPVQPANTTVYWYVRVDGCDCSTVLYDDPGVLQSFSYTTQ